MLLSACSRCWSDDSFAVTYVLQLHSTMTQSLSHCEMCPWISQKPSLGGLHVNHGLLHDACSHSSVMDGLASSHFSSGSWVFFVCFFLVVVCLFFFCYFLLFVSTVKVSWCLYCKISISYWTDDKWQTDGQYQLLNLTLHMHAWVN